MSRPIAALSLLFMLCLPCVAMTVTPMGVEMVTLGRGARAQFTVANDSGTALPVEIVYERLSYDENGKRHSTKAGDELLILPPTALIRPGSRQTFRLQWVGNPEIKESASFMVYAKQLPLRVAAGRKTSQVQIVSAFGIIVNVAPVNGQANLKLLSWRPVRGPKGGPAVEVMVQNPTNVHALMSKSHLRIGSVSLSPDTLLQRVGFGVVGPHKKRRFIIPLEGLNGAAAGKATLKYKGNGH